MQIVRTIGRRYLDTIYTCPEFATLPHINLRAVNFRLQLGSMTAGDFPPSCVWRRLTNLKVLIPDARTDLGCDWAQCFCGSREYNGSHSTASCV